MKQERWPDFIVIGAGKSGTTALNEYFTQHPDIFMATKKEPNFFSLESVDIDSYENESSRQYHLDSVYIKDDYLKLFAGAKPSQVTGEISNQYLYSDCAYKSILDFTPNSKLIAMLRQPADRLYSRYLHLVREDAVPAEGWDRLFDKDTIWWRRPDLVTEGYYHRHLSKFYKHFPAGNIKVFLYDDFKADPNKVLSEMFEFIGVNAHAEIDTDLTVNKSGRPKKNMFNYLLGQKGFLVNLSKKVFPEAAQNLKRNKQVIKYLNKARNRHIVSEKISPELRNRITSEIYQEDIQQLETLLKRDLSSWLHPKKNRVS